MNSRFYNVTVSHPTGFHAGTHRFEVRNCSNRVAGGVYISGLGFGCSRDYYTSSDSKALDAFLAEHACTIVGDPVRVDADGKKFKPEVVAGYKVECDLAELRPGIKVESLCGAKHVVTDETGRPGFVKVCQLDSGTVREYPESAKITKRRGKLFFVPNFVG